MRLLSVLALVCAPLQALALSCLPPSVARSYLEADAAEDSYVVVKGYLQFDTRALPKTHATKQRKVPQMTHIPARLQGRSLSEAGFKLPFDRQVTLEVACFGPWCGGAPVKSEVLVFVRRDVDGFAIGLNPCGGFLFVQPKPAQIKQVERCRRGGTCTPQTR